MGCCAAKGPRRTADAQGAVAQGTSEHESLPAGAGGDEEDPEVPSEELGRLVGGSCEPTLISCRDLNGARLANQRAEAAEFNRNDKRSRSKTRVALESQISKSSGTSSDDLSRRISRMGTNRREKMIAGIKDSASTSVTSPDVSSSSIAGGPSGGRSAASDLDSRLGTLGLATKVMDGDGNCQFRSMAYNLFGEQKHHAAPRAAAVAHMKKHRDFFGVFFETAKEFDRYLKDMARNRTWGDELTLRAAVEAYGCEAHVITSEPANWYLVYQPESDAPALDPQVAVCPKKVPAPRKGKQIFLSYVSPVHYNAIMVGPGYVMRDSQDTAGSALTNN